MPTQNTLRLTITAALMGFSIMAAQSQPAAAAKTCTIKGKVWSKSRVALPPGAVLSVRLEEQGIMDVAAKEIASYSAPAKGKTTRLSFKLAADCKALKSAAMPGFSVRIEQNGQLLFVNDTIHAYNRGAKTQSIEIVAIKP